MVKVKTLTEYVTEAFARLESRVESDFTLAKEEIDAAIEADDANASE